MYDPLQVRKSSARADYWVQFDPKPLRMPVQKYRCPAERFENRLLGPTILSLDFSIVSSGVVSKDSLTFSGQNPVFDGIRRDHVPRQGERRDAQWDTRQDIPQYDSWAGDGNGFAQIDKAVNRFD